MIARATACVLGAFALSGCSMMAVDEPISPPPALAPAPEAVSIRAGCTSPNHRYTPAYGENIVPDQAPEAITKVPPEYSDGARKANVSGTVVMSVLVCEHGNVLDARVTESIPMLDAAALKAVSFWKFRPGMSGSEPVPTWIPVPIRFTLN